MLEKKAFPQTRTPRTRVPKGEWSIHKVRPGGHTCILSLPAHVRAYLSIKAGDYVAIRVDDGAMLLRKIDLETAIAQSLRVSTQEGQ